MNIYECQYMKVSTIKLEISKTTKKLIKQVNKIVQFYNFIKKYKKKI